MKKKLLISTVTILVFVCIYFGIKLYASNAAEERINLALEKNAEFIDVDYKNVSVDLIKMDVRISDIRFSPPNEKKKVKIREIIIHEFDDKSDTPLFLSVSLNGLELNPDKFGKRGENIRKLGYTDKLLANLKADYVYEKEKKELNIRKIGISADDVGEISISLHVGNIDLSPENFMALLFTFPQIIVRKAEIVYKDDSLAERFIRLKAREKNMEADKFRSLMVQEIEKEIEKEKNDFARNLLVKIRNFLNDPEEFSVSFTPETPSPLGEIMDEFEQSLGEHEELFQVLSRGPDFMSKQTEAYNRQANSDIKNAYTTAQVYYIDDDPEGLITLDKLEEFGFKLSEGVQLSIEGATQKNLLIKTWHLKGDIIYKIDSDGQISTSKK